MNELAASMLSRMRMCRTMNTFGITKTKNKKQKNIEPVKDYFIAHFLT